MDKLLLVGLILFLLIACTNNSVEDEENQKHQVSLTYTSADSAEARELALWYEAELIPSTRTVSEMLFKINYLRYCYKDTIKNFFLQNRFVAPWFSNELVLKYDSVSLSEIRTQQYSGWDSLPDYIKPKKIITHDYSEYVRVIFNKGYNPWRMSEIYSKLKGVIRAIPSIIMKDRGFSIYVGKKNGEISFLFSSLNQGVWHYYNYKNNEPIYVGTWSYNQAPKSSYWQEVKNMIDDFPVWGQVK